MQPSDKYVVDYTDGNGLKWTKTISTLYPSLGAMDNSIGISKYNAEIMRKIYRKPDKFNPLYDNSITIGTLPGQSPNVIKYFSRNAYPSTDANINTIIVNASTADGGAYAIGIDDDASNVINRAAMGSYRILRDVEYNKMLFNVRIREMSFTTHNNVIQKDLYEDPTYTDKNLKDIDDNKYYAIFYHLDGKVWNGSSWVDSAINPAYICTGSDIQTIQGAGSVFNNTFTTYSAAPLGTGQNIDLLTSTSNYYWSGENFNCRMNNVRYCLALSENITLKGSWTDDPDAVYGTIRQWLIDNSIAPNVRVNFEICRELVPVGNDGAVLFTQDMNAYLDNDNNLVIWGSTVHTFFMIKGSSLTKMIAGFGLYYLTDENASLTGITPDTLHNSSAIWLGEMSANGTTTGNWIKGADIANYNGYNKNGNITNPDFDPSSGGGGGGSDEDNNDPVNTAGAPYAKGLVNYYAMTAGSPLIDHISEALSTWDLKNTGKDLYKNLVSCKLIKPPAPIPTSGSEPFTIYGEKPQYQGADITLPVVSGNPDATFGPYSISRKFNDFRDYAPYTRVCIYLPYCGWCDLPSHVVGRSVTVKYFTDIIAATVRAVVFCNNNIIAEAAGVMGLDIPFTADAVGMKQAGVVSGLTAYAGGALQTAAGVAQLVASKDAKGLGNVFSGASKVVSAYTQTAVAFNENTTEISGKNGDGCSLSGATNIIIKIIRPKYGASSDPPYVPAGFAHAVGFVSGKQVRVGNVSGLLIADNVDTSGIAGATDAERAEIKRVLETGLIVNSAPE